MCISQPSMSGQRTSLHRESDPFHRFRILNSEFSAKAWGSLFLSLHNQGNRSWGQEPACELWKSLTLLPVASIMNLPIKLF